MNPDRVGTNQEEGDFLSQKDVEEVEKARCMGPRCSDR